jgi:hypothetical protein
MFRLLWAKFGNNMDMVCTAYEQRSMAKEKKVREGGL